MPERSFQELYSYPLGDLQVSHFPQPIALIATVFQEHVLCEKLDLSHGETVQWSAGASSWNR